MIRNLPILVQKILLEIPSIEDPLSLELLIDSLKSQIEKLDISFPSSEYNENDIKGHIREIINHGFSPKSIEDYRNTLSAKKQNEDSFKLLYKDVPIGFYRTTKEGKIFLANSEFPEILGYSSFDEFIQYCKEKPEFDLSYSREKVIDLSEKNTEIKGIESEWLKKDGKIIFIRETIKSVPDRDGNIKYYEGTIEDITEAKITQDSLKQSEERLRIQFETMPFGCVIWDINFRVLSWNPAAERIFGFTKAEAISKSGYDLILLPELEKDISVIWKLILTNNKSHNFIIENIKRDGKIITCEWTNTPLKDNNGHIIGVMSMIQDITERKSIEKSLIESEERLRNLFEQNAIGICFENTDGRYFRVNQKFCDIIGYPQNELCKMTYRDITHPDDLEEDNNNILKVLNSQLSTFTKEKRYIHKNGSTVWVNFTFSTIKDISGNPLYFIGFIEDITENKKAEQKIIESERKYRKIFENVQDIFYQNSLDGEILEISPSIERYSGYKREDLIGKSANLFYFSFEERQKFLDDLFQNEEVSDYEVRMKTKSGNIFYVSINAHLLYDITGTPCGIEGSLRDISMRKKIEQKLAKSESQFRSIWNASFDGMRLCDEDGIIYLVNNAFCKMVGKEKQEIEGKPLSIIYRDEKKDEILKKHINRFKTRTIDPHVERELVLWNGEKKWFELSNSFIEIENERVLSLSIFRDITERRLAESEKLKFKHLKSLEILAGGIGHDFRNILTVIKGQTDIAQIKCRDQNIQKNISSIKEATKKAIDLTQQLFIFAEGEASRKIQISIRQIINDSVKISLEGSIIKEIIDFKDSRQVTIDPFQLQQAFNNILINAREAMNDEGEIKISTSDIIRNDKNFVKIIISDKGTGIPVEYLDKIFDPYFSTKTRCDEKGSGLGLSVTYSIIRRHNGKISVKSKIGKGTTFEILLPSEDSPKMNL